MKDLEKKAYEGDLDLLGEILNENSSKIPKKSLNSALLACVRGTNTMRLQDSLQCLEQLIEFGANVKAEESEEGRTALMLACEKGYLELVNKLLDNGALFDHRDKKKRTALMYAVD